MDSTGRRKSGPRRRFFERFGFCPSVERPGGIIFHMVSVGEALAAINLIKAFQVANPQCPVIVTCTTQQGSNIIQQRLGDSVTHCYLPYDLPWFLNRFLKRTQARTLVILETELWPNLLRACFSRNIATLVINARLSEKSFLGYQKLAPLAHSMMHLLSHLCCQAHADAERFLALGLEETKLTVTGNLKFDLTLDDAIIQAGENLSERFNERPTWVAASTHPGEDAIVLMAHKALLDTRANTLLVIASRHIDRIAEIHALANNIGLSCAIHSQHAPGTPLAQNTQVYLVDTMGELMSFYASADISLVCGSLVEHGGHNPIEPALLHKPILAGPYNHNFQTIYDQLAEKDAVRFVAGNTAEELTANLQQVLETLFADQGLCKRLGDKAHQYIHEHTGATKRTTRVLQQWHYR